MTATVDDGTTADHDSSAFLPLRARIGVAAAELVVQAGSAIDAIVSAHNDDPDVDAVLEDLRAIELRALAILGRIAE